MTRENTIRAVVILALIMAAGLAITILTLDGDRAALALSARFEGSLGILILAFLDSVRVLARTESDDQNAARLEEYTIGVGDPVTCDQEHGAPLRGEVVGYVYSAPNEEGHRTMSIVVEHDAGDVRTYPMTEVRRTREREPTGGQRLGGER